MRREIAFCPIGHVENDVQEMLPPEEIAKHRSRIIVDEPYAAGLLKIEEVEDLLILFFFDRADHFRLQLHPRGDGTRPLRGVFATRTPYRPNPIGATVVHLRGVEGNVLIVDGLDALNGTPVLDIKPFAPAFDNPDHHHQE